MAMTDIGREAAEATSSNDSTSTGDGDVEYERIDVDDKQYAKMHPGPTALRGTITGLRYFPPAPDSDRRGTATFILANPEVPGDEEFEAVGIFESTAEKGDDYKVLNKDDDDVDIYDAGVSFGDMFESDEVDELPEGEYCVKMSSSAGRSVIRTLDVKGLSNLDLVRDDDYEIEIQENGYPTTNDALIEKHPGNDADNYTPPRYSRDPQLRPDVEGSEIVVMLQRLSEVDPDYDGDSYWATVLADLDDERQAELAQTYADDDYYEPDEAEAFIHEIDGTEFLRLSPTNEFEPDQNLLIDTQWIQWAWPSSERIEELREEQGIEVDE